jgi:hypothetical protein
MHIQPERYARVAVPSLSAYRCDTRALVNQQCRMAVTEGMELGERYPKRMKLRGGASFLGACSPRTVGHAVHR